MKRRPAAPACAAAAKPRSTIAEQDKGGPQYLQCNSKDSVPIVLIKRLLQKQPKSSFKKLTKQINKLKVLTLSSQCSGSNVLYFMVHQMMYVIKSKTKVQEMFSCEITQGKLDWIAFLTRELQGHSACAFANICEISGDNAQCLTHGMKCSVPCTFLSSCGFSCKNF